ncbi:dephospho-CoA kinase [Tabrizicola sp.]|uniref:dephospho-CoA kinase n=1 Tax=Tabrizicola sp. TaxID=2005166 RepID=UPI0035AE1B46
MSFKLGLTGGIGMGKSTTAQMFAAEGIPVWDADAAVHRLYGAGQPAVRAIAALFPQAIEAGAVNRPRLRQIIQADPSALDRINAAVHPLVAQDRARFLETHRDAPIVLLDVPLLFEIGLDTACDGVAVVSVPPEVQRERVLARGTSEADFRLILSRQMPDAEKRARADYIIPTTSLASAQAAVKEVLAAIRGAKDA